MPEGNLDRRAILVTSFGNVLEWFDFALYGYFAPVIAAQFFPSDDPTAGLIATFGVFAAGYAMRILGGYLFGRLSDRAGRVRALQISVVLMAVPTTLMAFLPTYAAIGVAAPILLTLLRCLQGLSVGGEFATSVTMLVEQAPPERRGLTGSWAGVAATAGFLLGAGAGALVSALTDPAQLDAWGWRLPFLLGAVVGLTGSIMRRSLKESPEFLARGDEAPPALRTVWRTHRRGLLTTFAGTALYMVGFYIPFVYVTTFVDTETPVDIATSLRINTIGLVVLTAATPVFGHVSDRFGRRRTLLWGCAAMFALSLPMFVLFEQGSVPLDLLATVLFAVAFAVQEGVAPVLLSEQLDPEVRGVAFSTTFNVAAAVFGGVSPMLATILLSVTEIEVAPSLLIMAAAVVSAIAFWACRPAVRRDPDPGLAGSRAAA